MKKTTLALILSAFTFNSLATSFELSEDVNAKAWNQLQSDGTLKSEDEINQRLDVLQKMSDPLTAEERAAIAEYAKKYPDAIVVDSLHTTALKFPSFATEETTRKAIMDSIQMVDVLSMSVSNGDPKLGDNPVELAKLNRKFNRSVEGIEFSGTVDEIRQYKLNGHAAYFFNVQGSGQLDPENIDDTVKSAYDAGIRVTNIAYNTDNAFGTGGNSNAKANNTGLTEKGIELVKAFNKYGIVPDCSHSSDAVCVDIAKYSTKPVIASHSNPSEKPNGVNITRNINDEAIIAIAKTDGVVAINFLGGWHNPEGNAHPEALADSVEYVANLITEKACKNGRYHTGFGSDYIHTYRETNDFAIRNPEKFNPKIGYASISEMAFAIDAWGVAQVLEEKYGWTEEEIRGFLGENLLRVYKANFG